MVYLIGNKSLDLSTMISVGLKLNCAMICVLFSSRALAVDVLGQFRLGAYTRSLQFKEEVNGEINNDESVYSTQLKMEVYDISSHDDAFAIDVRDKVDSYGNLDRTNLSLATYNRLQVRELAYKRPWETNRFYFTVGRFALSEANVIDNDGAEAGFRFSRTLRFGLFGGAAPKDVITPYYINPDKTPDVNNTQGGVYVSYEKKSGFERSVYTNNALAIGPTYNLTDKTSHSYFFHMGLWNLNPNNRISSFLLQDLAPAPSLRRGSISHSYFDPKIRTNLSLSETNTEDYLIQRDLLDTLAPSAEQNVNADLRYRLFPALSVDLSAGFSKRARDGKAANETALGIILPKFILATGSLRAQFGTQKKYLSKGNFVRAGYDYWNAFFSASIIHTISQETYDEDGFKNSRQITIIDGGIFLSDRLRGSLGYQREADDRLTATAFFMMAAYRFGVGSVAPIRNKPALFEEI